MAGKIVDFEARRDNQGRLRVYILPAGDGGGTYEVAGINDRFHPTEAAALRRLVEAGRYDEAEEYARNFVASYTDAGDRWTPYDAVESYLRDCIFNRGAGGAARIYQMALGVRVDGDVGPITIEAGERARAQPLLQALRASRERYEREVVGRDEDSQFWRGLVNRWNNALAFAEQFLDLGGNTRSSPSRQARGARALAKSDPDSEVLLNQDDAEFEEKPGHLPIYEANEEEMAAADAGGEREAAAAAEVEVAPEPTRRGARRSQLREGPSPATTGGLNIQVLDSPLSTRTRNVRPTLIVLHATAGASARSSIEHLRNVGFSYHYIIARDGRDVARTRDSDGSAPIIFKCVDDAHRAAHVGSTIPAPSGEGSINLCSIGISLANIQSGGERYTPGQIQALDDLLTMLTRAHPSIRHLTNHVTVQPWNRSDPLSIDGRALAAAHGLEFFQPTAQQIRDHRPS